MSELRSVYCKHCRQTFLSDDLEKCSACGKVGGMLDAADEEAILADLVTRKQAEAREQTAVGEALRFYRLLRLSAAGVVCIGLGLAMILVPDLRDNPRTISGSDVVRGVGAGLVGCVLVGLLFLAARRRQ